MSLFIFLTVVQALIAAALVGVILMQQSEGGGLGMGGSPSGLMSARGAADFLTRATGVLATLFVILSIALAGLAVGATSGRKIDTSLNRTVPAAPANPLSTDPLAGAAPAAPGVPPAPAPGPADPLAGAAAVPGPARAPVAKPSATAHAIAKPVVHAAEPKAAAPAPAPKAAASAPAAAPAPALTLPAPAAT